MVPLVPRFGCLKVVLEDALLGFLHHPWGSTQHHAHKGKGTSEDGYNP